MAKMPAWYSVGPHGSLLGNLTLCQVHMGGPFSHPGHTSWYYTLNRRSLISMDEEIPHTYYSPGWLHSSQFFPLFFPASFSELIFMRAGGKDASPGNLSQ